MLQLSKSNKPDRNPATTLPPQRHSDWGYAGACWGYAAITEAFDFTSSVALTSSIVCLWTTHTGAAKSKQNSPRIREMLSDVSRKTITPH